MLYNTISSSGEVGLICLGCIVGTIILLMLLYAVCGGGESNERLM